MTSNNFIKQLVDTKYDLFNVNIKKCPVNRQGGQMKNWINKTFEELRKQHNYNSKLWGMRLGKQENGKCILSLDFDVYNKTTNGDCENTKKILTEYLENCSSTAGMYSSSTDGNINVLIDYTNSPSIQEFVKQIGQLKFTKHGLEILLGGNQVIPPSQTDCKKSKTLGNPRTFKNENEPFYIIENENCFTYQFLKGLFEEKLKPKKVCKKTETEQKPTEQKPTSTTILTIINNCLDEVCNTPLLNGDKFLDLLFDVIKNEKDKNGNKIITWDNWFQIAGILKTNNYDFSIFETYSEKFSSSAEIKQLWDSIKNNKITMSIYGLQNIAKNVNNEGYKEWLKKWNIYNITKQEVKDPLIASEIISKTLKHSLVFCNETWYMLGDNQLWRKEKEPTFYILKEYHKYLDTTKDKLNMLVSKAEPDDKTFHTLALSHWLSLYTDITGSSYLSVLTKCLKKLLTDDNFSNKLDNNAGFLAFKNGIMNLETKVFRPSILWSDFITQTIEYDYIDCDFEFLKGKLKQILNNNDEHLEYFLSIIGYSFIGEADLEKSIYFMIDKTLAGKGDNGKTFIFDILNTLMPNYVYRTKASLIEKNNTKIHKQLVMTKGKRLVFLEELPREKNTNAELLKEIGDGKKMENEIMFGTSETINIMFKMFVLSNHIPKIDPNESAVYNRYKQISFNSHFDRTGERTEEKPEELKFIAELDLSRTIKEIHYNEVFNLVVHYANKYYTNNKKLPKIPIQFINDTKQTQENNDVFGIWFNENCNKVDDGRIALKQILHLSHLKRDDVTEGMKRMGFIYNPELKGVGKDPFGKYYKGGFSGCELKPDECELKPDECDKTITL